MLTGTISKPLFFHSPVLFLFFCSTFMMPSSLAPFKRMTGKTYACIVELQKRMLDFFRTIVLLNKWMQMEVSSKSSKTHAQLNFLELSDRPMSSACWNMVWKNKQQPNQGTAWKQQNGQKRSHSAGQMLGAQNSRRFQGQPLPLHWVARPPAFAVSFSLGSSSGRPPPSLDLSLLESQHGTVVKVSNQDLEKPGSNPHSAAKGWLQASHNCSA